MHAMHPESVLLRYILVINLIYLVAEELFTIKVGGFAFFFNDPWNYLDIAMISCLALYISIESKDMDNSKLLGITNMLCWFRGLSHLRSFESTRIFIYLVVVMIKELKAFIAVMIGGIICFTTTDFILKSAGTPDSTDPENHVLDSLWSTFQLTIGEYSFDDLDYFGQMLFVLEAFFMNIILLNLIIALMSDTYENVMTNIVELDGRQLNTMILACEHFLFWKRDEGSPQHLYWVDYSSGSSEGWASSADYITTAVAGAKDEILKM